MFLAVDYHAAPDLAASEMHPPWHMHRGRMPRLFPHCVLLGFAMFPFFWKFGTTQGISMTAISEPLASCWHVVVLALDCYTRREIDRVRKPIQANSLGVPTSFQFASNRFAQVGDVGQGVQCWSWMRTTQSPM